MHLLGGIYMRKILILLIIVFLGFVLTSCNDIENNPYFRPFGEDDIIYAINGKD